MVEGTQNIETGLELLPQLLKLIELGEKMNREEDLACEGIQHQFCGNKYLLPASAGLSESRE